MAEVIIIMVVTAVSAVAVVVELEAQLEELDQAPKVEEVINGQLMLNKVKTLRLKLLMEH